MIKNSKNIKNSDVRDSCAAKLLGDMSLKGSLIFNHAHVSQATSSEESSGNGFNSIPQFFKTKHQSIELQGRDFIDLPKKFNLKFNVPGKRQGCDLIESIRLHISLPEVHNYLYQDTKQLNRINSIRDASALRFSKMNKNGQIYNTDPRSFIARYTNDLCMLFDRVVISSKNLEGVSCALTQSMIRAFNSSVNDRLQHSKDSKSFFVELPIHESINNTSIDVTLNNPILFVQNTSHPQSTMRITDGQDYLMTQFDSNLDVFCSATFRTVSIPSPILNNIRSQTMLPLIRKSEYLHELDVQLCRNMFKTAYLTCLASISYMRDFVVLLIDNQTVMLSQKSLRRIKINLNKITTLEILCTPIDTNTISKKNNQFYAVISSFYS